MLVVRIEVAVLAHALRVVHPVGVLALVGQRVPSEQVIAVVAHSFSVMLLVRVRAPSNCLAFSVSSLDHPGAVGVQLGLLWWPFDLSWVRFLGWLHLKLLQGFFLPLLVKLLVDSELINVVCQHQILGRFIRLGCWNRLLLVLLLDLVLLEG